MQRVGFSIIVLQMMDLKEDIPISHIHVSLRDQSGKSIFAVTDAELKNGGREGAAYPDTKFLSKEGESFLAGILDGVTDGKCYGPHELTH